MFSLSPRVCGNANQVCSFTGISNQLTAYVYPITQPAYAYFGLKLEPSFQNSPLGVPSPSALLSINTLTNTPGTPAMSLNFGAGLSNKLGSVAITTSIAVSLDGAKVYVAEKSNTTADIAVLSGGSSPQLLQRIALPGDVDSSSLFFIALTPDGKKLYVSVSGNSSEVYCIDLITDTVTAISEPFTSPTGIAISPDGQRVYIADTGSGSDGKIFILDSSDNQLIQTLEDSSLLPNPEHLALSPDGTLLAVVNNEGENIVVYDINPSGACTFHLMISGGEIPAPEGITFSSDSNTFYVTSSDPDTSAIYAVDIQTRTIMLITSAITNNTGVSLTPDNSILWTTPLRDQYVQFVSNLNTSPTTTPFDVSNVLSGAVAIQNFANFID